MVVGGGAAGVYGAIRAKTLAPNVNVVIIEKGRPLSKVCFCFLREDDVLNYSNQRGRGFRGTK